MNGWRFSVRAAMMRRRPPFAYGNNSGIALIMTCARPAIRSGMLGPTPLYGTWVALIRAAPLNISSDRWLITPTPPEA
jgi:hypothetical protein